MEREACVCDHGYERSDLCAEIIIIIIITLYLSKDFCLSRLYPKNRNESLFFRSQNN